METFRRKTKTVKVGGITIGGASPIVIQSMTNTDTANVESTVCQIKRLEKAGCGLVRCSVPNMESALALGKIKERIDIPLVADMHFDYRLAIAAIEHGADKLRINPGNIGGADRVRMVTEKAKERGIPIRIGVNSGSVEKELLEKYGGPTSSAIVESAMRNIRLMEGYGFEDIVVSVKSSDVLLSISCYRELSEKTDYPLHVGITEAGTVWAGGIKSAVGIGSLLSHGIGDTIRVSLTGDPVEEVRYAKQILKSLGHKGNGADLISCPTCARTRVDIVGIAEEVERRLLHVQKDIKVAVMGCAVNGPGEAKEADIGIAAGDGFGLIFRSGEVIGKFPEEELVDRLFRLIEEM